MKPTVSTSLISMRLYFFFCVVLSEVLQTVFATESKPGSCQLLPLTCLLVSLGSVGTLPTFPYLCCRDECCEVERGGRGCLLSRSSSTVTSKQSFIWLCGSWKAHLTMDGGRDRSHAASGFYRKHFNEDLSCPWLSLLLIDERGMSRV